MRLFLFSALMTLLLIGSDFGNPTQARACAGYTLTVGSDGTLRQELLTQIMAELIRQRTGTKIELVRFQTQAELQSAARQQDIDLLVATVTSIPESEKLYGETLKFLKPFGYQDSQVMPAFQSSSLKRFPALRRLLNRLAGVIDDQMLQSLEETLTEGTNLRAVAKKFLAEQKLIFGS